MTHDEWKAEGTRLFGPDVLTWRFICPVCHYEQSVGDYKAAGAPSSAAGFSCIGRWLPKDRVRESFGGQGLGPCDYAGGGLVRLNPVRVQLPDGDEIRAFAFADPASTNAVDPSAQLSGTPTPRAEDSSSSSS